MPPKMGYEPRRQRGNRRGLSVRLGPDRRRADCARRLRTRTGQVLESYAASGLVRPSARPPLGIGAPAISATIALVRQPAATSSTPWAWLAARNAFPAASIKVTSVKSKRTADFGRVARVLCQQFSNSRTQLPASLPSSWNVKDPGSSRTVIRSITSPPRRSFRRCPARRRRRRCFRR